MKIFVSFRRCPTAHFYYKVLAYLLRHATKAEIENYLNELGKRG